MKTINIIKSIFILSLFSLATLTLAQNTWMPPSQGPTGGNVAPPIHTGSSPQSREGALLVGSSGGNYNGKLSVVGGATNVVGLGITGPLSISSGNPGLNKILTSNETGFATWKTLSDLCTANPGVCGGGTGGGDGWWTRSGTRVSLLNINDDVGIGDNTTVYKGNVKFIHTEGNLNTAVGIAALGGGVGQSNNAFGNGALADMTSGNRNVGIGVEAGEIFQSGDDNIFIGHASARGITSGNGNVLIGKDDCSVSGSNNTNYNTAVGHRAGCDFATGGNNVAIGANANPTQINFTNSIVIGANATVNGSNKVRIGNSAITVYETQVPWTTGSDARFKKNIQNLDLGLDFIKNLRPVSYQLKNESNDSGLSYGFIAQEVEEALGGANAKLIDTQTDGEQMKFLRYDDLIAPMVKAMQEQQEQIETLKKEIEELKKR